MFRVISFIIIISFGFSQSVNLCGCHRFLATDVSHGSIGSSFKPSESLPELRQLMVPDKSLRVN